MRKSPKMPKMLIRGEFSPYPFEIRESCKGPNPTCKAHFAANRPIHIIPPYQLKLPETVSRLVIPSHHTGNLDEWLESFGFWLNHSEIIKTDKQLASAQNAQRGYFLMKGWIDPSRRNYAI